MLVGPLAGARVPPPVVAQFTVAPVTGLPKASFTATTSGSGSAALAGPVCASPLTTVTLAGAPVTAVAVKLIGEPERPGAVAVTVMGPAVVPAVSVVCATPSRSVVVEVGATAVPAGPAATAKATP